MSTQELLAAINHLPPEERLMLLEPMIRSLRHDLRSRECVGVPVEQVRGVLKTGTEMHTDDEVKETYADYLTEKYS